MRGLESIGKIPPPPTLVIYSKKNIYLSKIPLLWITSTVLLRSSLILFCFVFFFFFFFFFTGFLPCFRIFCFLYLCGSPPVNRLGPRSAVAVVVSVVMFVCSTQVRRETLGLIGVCFSKVWLLFYSCGLPLNGSASPFTTKIGGNIQAAQISPHYVAVEPCYVAPWPDCELRATSHEVNHGVKRKKKI